MVNYNYDRIKAMISSSDKENSYLAACLLRKDKSSYCKELLKKIPVQDRIKIIDDIYEELGIDSSVLIFKEPTIPFEKYINACVLLPLIVKVYNEDWVIDFNNKDQIKYFPYFKKVGLAWLVHRAAAWAAADAAVPSGFYYKNKDILIDSCTKFKDIYNDWLM